MMVRGPQLARFQPLRATTRRRLLDNKSLRVNKRQMLVGRSSLIVPSKVSIVNGLAFIAPGAVSVATVRAFLSQTERECIVQRDRIYGRRTDLPTTKRQRVRNPSYYFSFFFLLSHFSG
jgi:hypothetical protein